ncbi:RNA-guided endonuclease InsQ/TnpB family protein [Rhodococcus spelaei]|uniref:RNA-guided endonuclease InsQ/TnpB family protein n=1 Tax=Rhodococcus spelaei TaxID=2546320 RepID=UPI001FE514E1|nr:RNA-guided endonuclease TnpB family protein [Rhodococcus spelaei]
MEEVVRYNYRLRPGAIAQRALTAEWHRCRFLWNEAVHHQKSGLRPTLGKLSKLLTQARSNSAWLRDGSQVAQQQTLRTCAQALDHSFKVKGRGRPVFKARKNSLPSLEYTLRGFSLREGRLILPKGVSVPVVWSRELPSDPTSVRVTQDSLGHWYASFVVHRDTEPAPDAVGGIGVDWGVSTTATTTSSEFDLPYLGHRQRCAAELAKAQRKMSRRHSGKRGPQSRGYERAKRDAARLQKKAARQTEHQSRVWAKSVIDRHALIAVEDFTPKFLAKSTMARNASDAAIGLAKRELIDRGLRAGRKVVLVQPAYRTMTCSRCFARAKQRLGFAERVFRCHGCRYTAGRDRNAAGVILAVAERGHTSVEDVRQSDPSLRGG